MRRLQVEHPGAIDGSPEEVAFVVREQLVEIADELVALVELSAIQLRNAELTALLADDPTVDPDELAEALEATYVAGELHRLAGAAGSFRTLARRL